MKKLKKSAIKKVLIAISVIVLIILLILIFGKNPKQDVTKRYVYEDSEDLYIKNCKDDKNCNLNDGLYPIIKLSSNYDELNARVELINNHTRDLYELALNSNTDSNECSKVKDLYLHRLNYVSKFSIYETKKFEIVAVKRIEYDLCDESFSESQTESIIFDKKEKKIISQEEFVKKENITNEEIANAIRRSVNTNKEALNIDFEYNDEYVNLVYYYDVFGDIMVSYLVPSIGRYFEATIRYAS